MLDRVVGFCREQDLLRSGDKIICAVSGGADSMALLWAMYLLRDKLGISLECAHFNHRLRGEEARRDADFVRKFCADYEIPFHYGEGQVRAGDKGLEAAAREARYAFLQSLGGIIATAHTADDNAETVLMHLVRGTGLNGLGGIRPKNGSIIRPLLPVTRSEVMDFIREYSLSFVEDSTNSENGFLRNRLRHNVLPLLKAENPQFARSTSQMALRLREDEEYIRTMTPNTESVEALCALHPALRTRAIAAFLEKNGINEPGAKQLEAVDGILFSRKPSASVHFSDGIIVSRSYDTLRVHSQADKPEEVILTCPGSARFGSWQISAQPAGNIVNSRNCFTVSVSGAIRVRSRRTGDRITFAYGSKSLKKLFIDKKIPACVRDSIPVLYDDTGLLGVGGFGADVTRISGGEASVTVTMEPI